MKSLRRRADAKHLKLEAEVAEGVPRRIASDRLRIHQILVNLLDNAIKSTDQGTVRLTARVLDLPGTEPHAPARSA